MTRIVMMGAAAIALLAARATLAQSSGNFDAAVDPHSLYP